MNSQIGIKYWVFLIQIQKQCARGNVKESECILKIIRQIRYGLQSMRKQASMSVTDGILSLVQSAMGQERGWRGSRWKSVTNRALCVAEKTVKGQTAVDAFPMCQNGTIHSVFHVPQDMRWL